METDHLGKPVEKIRPAAKAGSWYEGQPAALRKKIRTYLDAAETAAAAGPVRALISPHAGYVYSGQTAACGFKAVEGRTFKRVIVLAPSHYERFEGGSIPDFTHYETPLGKIPLDRKTCHELLGQEGFTSVPEAHRDEHSLELQLPFLQVALEGEFTLVPILLGRVPPSRFEAMAGTLRSRWDDETLVVTSTDFTHYGPNFGYVPFTKGVMENLKKLDMGAVDKILAMDYGGFNNYVEETGATICGRGPVALLACMAAGQGMEARLLKYTTSGELTGDYANSVSYVSICFTASQETGGSAEDSGMLTWIEEQTLVRLARHTLDTFLSTGKPPEDLGRFEITKTLKEEMGVFVTLKKGGELRGCIGYLRGIMPLYKALMENTMSAASRDSRFPPVRHEELSRIHIEVSVLSPAVAVKDLEEIRVGRDGLIISKGGLKGTLLPQVPVEYGWDRTQFLEHACLKAGLDRKAYQDRDILIERYFAQVFSEKR